MLHAIEHTLIDSLKLLPFLFLTYLLIEYLEHRTSDKTKDVIKKSGKFGPFFGGLIGIIPQCGFSVTATNLYAGRVITLGTLIAVYLSTSDEMLPILISEGTNFSIIANILLTKLIIGIIAGFIIDVVIRKTKKQQKNDKQEKIGEVCEKEHCHCEQGILKSAIKHTISIFLFVFVISLILHIILDIIGEDTLSNFLMNQTILGPVIAGLIGLIPNCASSIVLTQLYLSGLINTATMIGGLLVNSGLGILILFRVNRDLKQNIKILILLYCIGVISGILLQILGINF